MVAATAAGLYGTLNASAMAMQQGGVSRRADASKRARYDRDYAVFLTMLDQRQVVDRLIATSSPAGRETKAW
jgi:ribulose kinase